MSLPSFFRSLGPRYLSLWVGHTITQLGASVAMFSIPLLVRYIHEATGTGSTLDFSIAYALETAPIFLVGIVGGVLLDRWALRSVMVVTNLLRACAFFYLAADYGNFGVPTVFVMAFLLGSLATLFDGALYAIIPALVKRERLADANSLASASIQMNDAVGPLIAGVLAATFATPAIGLFLTGLLFVAGAIALYGVGQVAHHRDPDDERRPFFTEAVNGIKYVWSEPRLRITAISAAVPNFVMGFIEATFLVLFFVVIEVPDEAAAGILLSALGVGGVVGALLAPRIIQQIGLGRTMILGLLISGFGLFAVMYTKYGWLAIILQAGWVVGISMINISMNTIRQHYATESMLGRVITASRAIGWATLPIGALIGGWLGQTESSYPIVARIFPLILIATALWLMTTLIWSNTFGPGFGEDLDATPTPHPEPPS